MACLICIPDIDGDLTGTTERTYSGSPFVHRKFARTRLTHLYCKLEVESVGEIGTPEEDETTAIVAYASLGRPGKQLDAVVQRHQRHPPLVKETGS